MKVAKGDSLLPCTWGILRDDFCALNLLRHLFELPTVLSLNQETSLWNAVSLILRAPRSRSHLLSHRRLRIIGLNEGLPSGHCTIQTRQTKWQPSVTPYITGGGNSLQAGLKTSV